MVVPLRVAVNEGYVFARRARRRPLAGAKRHGNYPAPSACPPPAGEFAIEVDGKPAEVEAPHPTGYVYRRTG